MKISLNNLRRYIDLPADWEVVRDLMEDIGLEVKKVEEQGVDAIFTLELLANRGDHHSYYGLAREIRGRTGGKLSKIQYDDVKIGDHTSQSTFVLKTPYCYNYTITEFVGSGNTNKLLDENYLRMIELQGNNSVMPVVDVTNFVNVEIGQPLHVFDADKIEGPITVRLSEKGERALLLFTQEAVQLPEGTLVIADNSKILAVAGVIGCEESKPTEQTKRIFLESATFDPVKVRLSARHLGASTTASMRFERGADPELAVLGAQRAAHLLKELGWDAVGAINTGKPWEYKQERITLNTGEVNSYFASSFSPELLKERLKRYEFAIMDESADRFLVEVPSHRIWDVKEQYDLYEEIAKSVGYNEFKSMLPENMGHLESEELEKKKLVEEIFIGEGFFEVFTDGFYGDLHKSRLPIEEGSPLWEHVHVLNANDTSYSMLKNNNVSQAVEIVKTNANFKTRNVKVYEWTRLFIPGAGDGQRVVENPVLWAIAGGNLNSGIWDEKSKDADFFYMKGIIEKIASTLKIELEVKRPDKDFYESTVLPCLHPTRRGVILHDGKAVGVIGEVHPKLLSAWKIKDSTPCFLELTQSILSFSSKAERYVPPSEIQLVERDVCIKVPSGFAAMDLADYFRSQSEWIEKVVIKDVFKPEQAIKSAVTYSILYNPKKAGKVSFSGEEINEKTESVINSSFLFYNMYALERG